MSWRDAAVDLSAAELLRAWEQATTQHPAQQALTLLAAACPEPPAAGFAQMSIGQRDACLLSMRERLFGTRLTGVARCPHCSEQLELSFDGADIRSPLLAVDQTDAPLGPTAAALELHVDGCRVRFRLPNSVDLLAVLDIADAASLRQELLHRCVLSVERGGEETPPPDVLPSPLADAVGAAMEAADPQGNVQLALDCPACGHHWLQAFDILTYLWREIDDWAQRTLREVHLLASAYGWSEQEILALSARRRQLYLEMVLE